MANPVTGGLAGTGSFQDDANSADSNNPQNLTTMAPGSAGDLSGELRRLKSEMRALNLNLPWIRVLGLNTASVPSGNAPVFSSATAFTLTGDWTVASGTSFQIAVGQRVKALVTAGTIFGTVSAVTVIAGITTVTTVWDGSSALDSGLSEVQFGTPAKGLSTTSGLTFDKQIGNPLFDLVSSAAPTAVYSKSIPGNTLGTRGILRITLDGDLLNNTGAPQNWGITVAYGAANLAATGTISFNSNGSRLPIWVQVILAAAGATNAQFTMGFVKSGTPTVLGASSAAVTNDLINSVATAVDSTTAQTLAATVTLGANNANLEYRLFTALTELL